LVDAVDKVCIHPYYKALYKAMHLVAFNAFLRVGEMTSDVANNDGHCLQHRDVVVDKQDCDAIAPTIEFVFLIFLVP
jgi:hypothetical protein